VRFRKIVVVGGEVFTRECREKTQALSEMPVHWIEERRIADDFTASDADALLVALRVDVPDDICSRMPKLRYVGVYGTNLTPIPRDALRRANVAVTNVHGYCDPETAQWCVMEMINVVRGRGPLAWSDQPRSLAGRKLGIVGLGEVGIEVAKLAHAIGFEVAYTGRQRKEAAHRILPALRFETIDEILAQSELISLHTPASTRVLGEREMDLLAPGAVLINTCIGEPYDRAGLMRWLDQRNGLLVLDALAGVYHPQLRQHPRVFISPLNAHTTLESEVRRRSIFFANMHFFLAGSEH
jgi:phosphoglycerate dehydrogenase-like enzyme